ncbi:hypothetical protein ACFC26_09755 [Kitasatospora purpeofusca]|uniref:hypothetical protein n=1 Tax=Kitasatospora purpeofusca TaxID=67352 RepID=UPI0035DB9EFC
MNTHPIPENLILVKGDTAQGAGNELFGIWPSGYVRQITPAEHEAWGYPDAHREIPYGQDEEFLQLAAYDRALRA